MEPLLEMCIPKPPHTPKSEQETEVTPPVETEFGTVSEMKPMVESEPIPLVLKTLKELKQENETVRSRSDKQEDMFKKHAQTNTKI